MGDDKAEKKTRKALAKAIKKGKAPGLIEGFGDFSEDFIALLMKRQLKPKELTEITLNGTVTKVRPAYIFSVKVEYAVKFVIGLSLIISAILATVWGAIRMSDLFSFLVNSIIGRIILIVIGLAYVILGIYKVLGMKTS